MKQFKGTPGPWSTVFDTVVESSSGCGICETFGDKSSYEEDLCNAKLIAASPELLSALQHLVEVYDDPTGKQWTTASKKTAIAEARAAIDKALGE